MMWTHAPVPQLDRGAVYETESCGFKSRRARQFFAPSHQGGHCRVEDCDHKSLLMLHVISNRKDRAVRPCPVYLFAPIIAVGVYLPLTLMTLGLVSSALGRVSVSTPFPNVASAFSAFTGTFSVSVRENAP